MQLLHRFRYAACIFTAAVAPAVSESAEKDVEMIVRTAFIAMMVFVVDYALRGAYMVSDMLQDRWYERPPGKYMLVTHRPSWTTRLFGVLVTLTLTLALV